MLEKKLWFAVCLPLIWEMELKVWTIFFFQRLQKKIIFRKIRMPKKCVLQRIPKRNIFAVKHTKKFFF